MTSPTADRFHLTLTVDGRPARHGWWSREATARDKFTLWVGEYSGRPGSSVTLVDEAANTLLMSWPDPA